MDRVGHFDERQLVDGRHGEKPEEARRQAPLSLLPHVWSEGSEVLGKPLVEAGV